jgi:hypothetical protein
LLLLIVYNNFHYTESDKKRMPDLTCMLTFIPFKSFGLLNSKVRARAGASGAASKFLPRAGAA